MVGQLFVVGGWLIDGWFRLVMVVGSGSSVMVQR